MGSVLVETLQIGMIGMILGAVLVLVVLSAKIYAKVTILLGKHR